MEKISERQMSPETRRINIVRMRRNNPCATLQEIGDRFDVTRERVRQVLAEEGKTTIAFHQHYLCLQCGKDIGIDTRYRFCGRDCQYEYNRIKIACTYCGQLKEYLISALIWQIEHNRHGTDLFFCSKQCQGKWMAENYGFAITGNRGNREKWGKQNRKWDWSKVYELRDATGWGAVRVGRALGIPAVTVGYILRKSKFRRIK